MLKFVAYIALLLGLSIQGIALVELFVRLNLNNRPPVGMGLLLILTALIAIKLDI